MEFEKIANLFEKLEQTSKRLEKILILRDFIEENKTNLKQNFIIFDIIAGNFQREINKKNIGISIKTILSIVSFLSKKKEREVEKEFEKKGDIGLVAIELLNKKSQQTLINTNNSSLTLEKISSSLKQIANISGNNANKLKKEILTELFFLTKTDLENKFLARLLIDDLRIGVSEGTLKEAFVNFFFPKILNIHTYCPNCDYFNLNLNTCFKCQKKIDLNNQEKIINEKYQILEFNSKPNNNLTKFIGQRDESELFKSILRTNKKKYIIKYENPRELYNKYLSVMEKKYNLINNFEIIGKELKENILKVLDHKIIILNPIKSMLGTRVNNVDESFEVVGKPALCDFKYDGLRVQIHNKKGEIKLFSRNLEEITKQFPEIVQFIYNNFKDKEFIIDSECVAFNYNSQTYLPFQILSKRITKKDVDKNGSNINIAVKAFDILFLDNKNLIDLPYEKRREILEELFINKPLKQKINFDIKILKKMHKNFEY